jgi:putative membrane protein
MVSDFHPGYLLNALVYSVLGIVLFAASFAIVDRMTPYDLWREICEHRNTALAIMVGAMSIGICIIIAAAVH